MDHVHNGGPWRLSVYGRPAAMALELAVRAWRARGEHGDPHRR
jgi:hypothetical protein